MNQRELRVQRDKALEREIAKQIVYCTPLPVPLLGLTILAQIRLLETLSPLMVMFLLVMSLIL